MTALLSLRLHRDAAVTALRSSTRLPGDSADRIGSSQPPPAPPGSAQPETPYAIVYGLPSTTTGTVAHPDADLAYVVQVKCVGASDDEADGLAEGVIATLLDPAAWSIPGRDVSQPTVDLLRPAVPDPDLSPPRYGADVLIRVPTTPASP